MKTVTEFSALVLKNALKTREELVTAGKTPEELPAAMGEALKLEGDRLNLLLSSLEAIGTKTNDLKRVVVIALAEGEKAPSQAKQVGQHGFMVEFYPSLNPPKQGRRDERGGRGERGKGKGGRGKGRGGKGRGDRDEKGRGPRGDRPQRGERGDRGERRGPAESGPRPTPELKVKKGGESQT